MSEDVLVSINEIFGLVSLFILSLYIVPEHVSTKENYISFIKIFHFTLFALLVIGIILGYGNKSLTVTDFHNRIRYKSVLDNANSLGSYTMLGCITSIILIYLKKEKIYVITFIINLIVLILTDSRTAMFTLLIFLGMILFFYFYQKNKNKKNIIRLIITIFSFLLIIAIIILISKLENMSMSKINEVLSGRIDSWVSPFRKIDNVRLIFGRGSFSHYENPHNYYIKSILSWGIAGTSIFILITIEIIVDIFKKVRSTEEGIPFREIDYITFSLLLAFLSFSIFESMFFNIGNLASVFLWFNLGLSLSGEKYE